MTLSACVPIPKPWASAAATLRKRAWVVPSRDVSVASGAASRSPRLRAPRCFHAQITSKKFLAYTSHIEYLSHTERAFVQKEIASDKKHELESSEFFLIISLLLFLSTIEVCQRYNVSEQTYPLYLTILGIPSRILWRISFRVWYGQHRFAWSNINVR